MDFIEQRMDNVFRATGVNSTIPTISISIHQQDNSTATTTSLKTKIVMDTFINLHIYLDMDIETLIDG